MVLHEVTDGEAGVADPVVLLAAPRQGACSWRGGGGALVGLYGAPPSRCSSCLRGRMRGVGPVLLWRVVDVREACSALVCRPPGGAAPSRTGGGWGGQDRGVGGVGRACELGWVGS